MRIFADAEGVTDIAVTSNENAISTLGQLREGTFTLPARSAGFKETVTQDYVQLEIGAVETKVAVTAVGRAIETETAR